jgi:hypothetical protein
MAMQIIFSQTRQNNSIDFHDASDEFKNLKAQYVEQNKMIENEFVFSNDGNTKTWTLTFASQSDYIEFMGEPERQTYYHDMASYNETNSITYSTTVNFM